MSLPNMRVIAEIDEQDDRQAYLEALYMAYGRNDPAHPDHGHYTGLLQQRAQTLLTKDREGLLSVSLYVHKRRRPRVMADDFWLERRLSS